LKRNPNTASEEYPFSLLLKNPACPILFDPGFAARVSQVQFKQMEISGYGICRSCFKISFHPVLIEVATDYSVSYMEMIKHTT
jgi:hypothetical protein